MSRDDFTLETTRKLGERVNFLCSNPTCSSQTKGPHSDPTKSVTTGIACHIHAASPGGPRYDASQTPDERKAVENGIWLCTTCSTRIDRDPDKYPVETLRAWKEAAERAADKSLGQPIAPALHASTARYEISEGAARALTFLARAYVAGQFPNHNTWNFNLDGELEAVARELYALDLLRPLGIGRGHAWLLTDRGRNWVMQNRDGIPGVDE